MKVSQTDCESGQIIVDTDKLVASEGDCTVVATVTDDYGIRLFNGDVLNSPSRAATRAKELVTRRRAGAKGWKYWQLGEDGLPLFDVRAKCLAEVASPDLKSLFCDGFYDYCAERQDFVAAYSDLSDRPMNNGWYASFGLGMRGIHASAFFAQRDGWVGVDQWITDFALYERLLERRDGVEVLLADLGGRVAWREPGEKSRELQVRLDTDVSSEYWDELYAWLATGLLRMHMVAGLLDE